MRNHHIGEDQHVSEQPSFARRDEHRLVPPTLEPAGTLSEGTEPRLTARLSSPYALSEALCMDDARNELRPFDECHAAFMGGGLMCLAGAAFSVYLRACPSLVGTSVDGTAIALLLLLSAGGGLVNQSIRCRLRVHANERRLR